MRSAIRILIAVALLSGCGNYGNLSLEDSAYLNALPSSQDLKYDVPKSAAQPACALGQSKIAGDTHDLGLSVSTGVVSILTVIDFVKAQPPTTRAADSRTWGPFPDRDHPGVTDLVVMTKVSDEPRFTFALEQKRTGDYLTVLSADLYGAQAHKGHGTMQLDYGAIAALGDNKQNDPVFGTLHIDYDLTSDPRTIHLSTVGVPKGMDVAVASYLDGQVRIDLTYIDGTNPTTGLVTVTSTSKFDATGAGQANWALDSVKFKDTASECWDALYCRTYLNDLAGWTSPPCTGAFCEKGNKAACPSNLH